MTTALPPHVLHSVTPLSALSALNALTTFLNEANNNPAYRPDSTLTERGPVSTSTSGNSSLVLHHLNRIKLGLEGIRIGAAEIEAQDASLTPTAEAVSKIKKHDKPSSKTPRVVRQESIPTVTATAESREPIIETTETAGGEWEDKDLYELAQDEGEVDMNNERDPAGGLEQPANAQEAADMMEVEETQPGTEVALPLQDSQTVIDKPVLDKEERKRLKKLKQLQEKKQAEERGKARVKKDKKQKVKP